MIDIFSIKGHSSKVPKHGSDLISFTSACWYTLKNFSHKILHILSTLSILIRYFSRNMILWWISLIIFFFENRYLESAKAKYIIQMDIDIQFDVPNHNHNVSFEMPQHKSSSTDNRKLISSDGKYKVHKTKPRSLTGRFILRLENMLFSFFNCIHDLFDSNIVWMYRSRCRLFSIRSSRRWNKTRNL